VSDQEFELLSKSTQQTIEIGAALGASCAGGELVAMIGELGTGKTHLVKGIAQGLAVEHSEAVTSPTFTLIREYEGRLPLIHVDAYRLENAAQLEALGFDELIDGAAVVVIEWADRVASLLTAYDPWVVRLRHHEASQRWISIEPAPPELKARLARFA